MVRRWVRIAVVVVALAVLSFLGNQIRLADQTFEDEQNVERVFTDLSWTLTLSLTDLRAAQQAYVAAGQDRTYWTEQVTSRFQTIRGSLDNLRRLATHPTSIDAIDSADATIEDLERMDQRAREHTDLDQSLLASDLIFTDGLELATNTATHVELARATERTARNQSMQAARSTRTRLLMAGAGIGLLAMLLLVPGQRAAGLAPVAGSDEESGAEATPPSDDRLTLDDLDLGEPLDDANSVPADASAAPARATAAPAAVPDLRAAADLCTDLGRLADAGQLSALLARSAELMNASGLILWVRDAGHETLRPAVGHGYTARTLAAMGALPRDGDNATAAAFRAGQMQVVEGGDGPGALAAPLLAAEQCVGVLSAELNDGWEASPSVQATMAILAAQLATLVPASGPASAQANPPAEAHG